MIQRFLVVAPLALAVACGPVDPSPSPTPTATPDPCATAPSAYGKAIAGSWIPACSLAQNIYNDPQKALGPTIAEHGSVPAGRNTVRFICTERDAQCHLSNGMRNFPSGARRWIMSIAS